MQEFYANYFAILKNMTPSENGKDMKKQPCLDAIRVKHVGIDISFWVISMALFGKAFVFFEETPKYDFQINNLKKSNGVDW